MIDLGCQFLSTSKQFVKHACYVKNEKKEKKISISNIMFDRNINYFCCKKFVKENKCVSERIEINLYNLRVGTFKI